MNICELLESSNSQSSEDEKASEDTLSQIEVTDQQNENSTINEETTTKTLEEMSNLQASNKALVETNSSSESENSDNMSTRKDSDERSKELSDTPIDSVEDSTDEQNAENNEKTSQDNNLEETNDMNSSNDSNSGSSSHSYNQNNIDFGHSILTNSSLDDEFNFDRLGPFEKLCSLCDNPTPSNMESASKYLVPALEFCSTQDDFMLVFSYLRKYCFFSDILLRSLWLEQIQNIIQFIHQEAENIPIEFKDNFNMANEIALLISELMYEPAYQVKKYATASLLCIVEKQLLNNEQIEKIIIPSLLNLVKENNEDFHIDCISLFGKLAPLIGRDLTAKYFLEPFCRLSTSHVFHTRKACASNITEIANIVSTEDVEKHLMPHFCEFLKDQVWAIRKVCADIFSLFASKCTRKTREQVLTEYFIRLLDDNSRWVKISAYKSLGSFIATFSKDFKEKEEPKEPVAREAESVADPNAQTESNLGEKQVSEKKESEESATKTEEETTEYNNFNYWRNSIPSMEETIDLNEKSKESESKTISATSNLATDSKTAKLDSITIPSRPLTSVSTYGHTNSHIGGISYSGLYSSTNSLYPNLQQQNSLRPIDQNQLSEQLKQDVVPSILLSYFITMVEMNAQNSLDAEMNYNCAFNFPAIALTLGLANWKYVKDLYKKLAEDNNWKVRQTLAYSIHELALILGTECTQSELMPVFDSFIKDVDEVRMGIVSNLSKFLGVLSLEYRRTYMPKLNDFLKMDNQRNWRFRNELGLQIADFCGLFPSDCIAEYIQPVTFILALDKVAEVRVTSIKALTLVLKQFEINKDKKYRRDFLNDVIRTFADNNKWSFRQLFVVLCDNIFKEQAYQSLDEISTDLLPKLFSLRNDPVANIRVCLARVITSYLLNLEYYTKGQNSICNELNFTIECLSKDSENDVRSYFVTGDDFNNINNDQTTSLPAYEEVVGGYGNMHNRDTSEMAHASAVSNSLTDYELHHDDRLNDSMNLINTQVMNYNETSGDVDIEEDDEDDDDEIIDTSKVGQLKIVNELDNYMEDDSDEIIDTSPMSPDMIPMKIASQEPETICNLNNHLYRTNINDSDKTNSMSINFPDPLTESSSNNETKS